jgi:hypothetical protein
MVVEKLIRNDKEKSVGCGCTSSWVVDTPSDAIPSAKITRDRAGKQEKAMLFMISRSSQTVQKYWDPKG